MSFFMAQGGYSQEDREKLEKAIEAREKKYGYKRGSNASLTKPKEYANIAESDFADPVGYNYPVDKAHVGGAITYWHHMDHRKAYTDPKARAFITERIVRAAIKFGKDIAYDPKDPDYQKLPESLKKQMKGYSQKGMLEDYEVFRAYQRAFLKNSGSTSQTENLSADRKKSDIQHEKGKTPRVKTGTSKTRVATPKTPKAPRVKVPKTPKVKKPKEKTPKSMLEDVQGFRGWQEALYGCRGKRVPTF